MTTIYDIPLTSIDGNDMKLGDFEGEVLLIVNVASECGLTPQYTGLQSLYDKYSGQGFRVIGLPCNQFGGQEPGTEADVKNFCETQYQVTFPMTSKIEVKGQNRHDLYTVLTGDRAKFPGKITWNFEKFLLGRDGEVLQRYSPKVEPESEELVNGIESALAD